MRFFDDYDDRYGFRKGEVVSTFLCEKGLGTISVNLSPQNPLTINEDYSYQFIPFVDFSCNNHAKVFFEDQIEFESPKNISNLLKALREKETIAIGFKERKCPEELPFHLDSKYMGVGYDYIDDYDLIHKEAILFEEDILGVLLCTKQDNLYNYGKEELSDEEYFDCENFLYDKLTKLACFLNGEIYTCEIINIDDLENPKSVTNIYELYDINDVREHFKVGKFFGFIGRSYFSSIKQLKDIDKYFKYQDVSSLLKEKTFYEDSKLIEIEDDLYSIDSFASEYIVNISKKKYRNEFLEVLAEKLGGERRDYYFR